MQKMINKRAKLYGVAAVIMALMLGVLCYNFGVYLPIVLPSAASTTQFKTFSSYEELKSFLLTNSKIQGAFQLYGPWDGSLQYALQPNTFGGSNTKAYSGTNIQVAGVDEADIVKTDGEYIYVLSNGNVSILRAYPPDEAQVLSTITFGDMTPIGIFVSGDRLTVLGSKYNYPQALPYYWFAPRPQTTVDIKTFVSVYDISERTHPALLEDYKVSGSYFGSRMIGDYVYFIASQPAYVYDDALILPTISSSSGQKEVSPTDIYYTNVTDEYFQYTTFVALNMQNTTELPTYTTLMFDGTGSMYVSLNNIYVTFHKWQGDTSIYRMHIANSNITWVANGTVLGHELDQFSMDEYNGYFRIATNAWVNGSQQNNLYVLDMNLSVVGKLENLATGENLYSVRFMDNRGYIVTFQKTDPLFVIDLTEPTHPYVLGQLHIPGYSDYLHPYDENHFIGVGKQTVEAEQGYFAWYLGIKISLFDVTNVTDPKQISNYTIGDRGSDSPVLSDHKAFLFDKSTNLLVIPVTVAKIDADMYPGGVPPYAYGTQVWQGAYVFRLSPEEGFVFRGGITHLESDTSVQNSSYWIKRSLYIENVLYTVSDKKIKMNNLADLTLLKEVELP